MVELGVQTPSHEMGKTQMQHQNWGKAILAVLGATCVVVLIAVPTSIYLNGGSSSDSQKTYTIEDYFNSSFNYKSYNMRWISDNEYLHKTSNGTVVRYNVETGAATSFLFKETFAKVEASDYLVSADTKFVCLASNYSKMWRHSFTASYSIFNTETQSFVETGDKLENVQLLIWAPTGNKLAYVQDYNVHVKLQAMSPAVKITADEQENIIFNGIPDWVYEEEMFSSTEAMWWSPGGRFLAYAQFNDTQVHNIEYSWYGTGQYPETVIIPYPKAGSPNPDVKLFTVDTTNNFTIEEVVVPSSVGESDHYLSSVIWVTDERIAVQWQKRSQNHVTLQLYDFNGTAWVEKVNYVETSQTGWVGQFSPLPPFFTVDNISFYQVMSDTQGYKHIHYVNAITRVPITSGAWEVISISSVTADSIYFVSNEHNQIPGQRNLYRVATGGGSHERQCLTCDLDTDRCQYNSGYFSQKASYYRMDCSGPGLPLFTLRDARGAGSEIMVLEDNRDLEKMLENLKMPSMRRDKIRLGEFDLWYQMILPPDFDKSKKYPILIDVYAGPCSQKVDYRFRLSWATYLASTENIIVASFDGRGSGYQGDKIMHSIYKRLGTYEVEDQISAARKFIEMGFVDKERIAIWGWSYGGYVTSMVLGAGSGVFKCGMAVAPVSKWEYYDSIYTERYMTLPAENADFYRNSTVMGRAKNFKSVNYLLVHGTADDNVHFQQAAAISEALVNEQVDFEAMWYTDRDHGLQGSAHRHVYTHLSHFLLKCFDKAK
nr:dipeptidyl peptidase 4-like isoform X1 [Paramormyrops kingsleyae]